MEKKLLTLFQLVRVVTRCVGMGKMRSGMSLHLRSIVYLIYLLKLVAALRVALCVCSSRLRGGCVSVPAATSAALRTPSAPAAHAQTDPVLVIHPQ